MKWEYCECGCHGNSLVGVGLWVFNDLKDTPTSYHLHNGHGRYSSLIGRFPSMEKINEHVKSLVKTEIAKLSSLLEEPVLSLEEQKAEWAINFKKQEGITAAEWLVLWRAGKLVNDAGNNASYLEALKIEKD